MNTITMIFLLASLMEGINWPSPTSKHGVKKDTEEHYNTQNRKKRVRKKDDVAVSSTYVTIISVLFSDQDECQTGNHNCSHLAECTNTQGSYTCSCYSGTTGDGLVCSGV